MEDMGGVERDADRSLADPQISRIRHQYELLLRAASEGIFGLDAEGRVMFVNAAAESLLGWRSEEIIGRDMHTLVYNSKADGRAHSRRASPIAESLSSGLVRHVEEDVFQRKDGGSFPVEYTSTPMRDGERIGGVVVTFHDITERLDTQQQIRASRQRLRGLAERLYSLREQERSAIAREIHDVFGQELTALKIDLSWMRGRLGDGHAELIERIDQMITIADRMVAHTRTIASRLRPPVLDDLGLEAAIEALAEDFQSHTGWTCTLDLQADDLEPEPERDTAIYRIVQEALTNAARHSGASEVDISLKTGTGRIELLVTDNGKGIDREVIQSTRSLGLFGMRERAGVFGGRVEITSRRGTGTTVELSIPTAPAEQGRGARG
jgi:PAS domain S-box-containing protein